MHITASVKEVSFRGQEVEGGVVRGMGGGGAGGERCGIGGGEKKFPGTEEAEPEGEEEGSDGL